MKKFIMFGAGKKGKELLECLDKVGKPYPEECFDNEVSKWGQMFGNTQLVIRSPRDLKEFDKDEYLFIISTARIHGNEVMEQLKKELKNADIIDSHTFISGLALDYYDKKKKWDINYHKKLEKWLLDYRSEYEWHEKKLANLQNTDSTTWKRETEIARLHNYDIQDDAVVIDVGCGPTLKYSNYMNGAKVDYRPVDPLGIAYNQFAERYNFKLPQNIGFAFGEHLVSFFGKGSADFVLFDNSLDHVIDPLKCILESLRVLKIGGVLSLRHMEAEAQLGTNGGLHNWDLFMDYEDFVIANKDNYMNISKLLFPFCNIEVYKQKSEEYNEYTIIANFEKRAELSEEILNQYDSDLGNGILIETLCKLFLK